MSAPAGILLTESLKLTILAFDDEVDPSTHCGN